MRAFTRVWTKTNILHQPIVSFVEIREFEMSKWETRKSKKPILCRYTSNDKDYPKAMYRSKLNDASNKARVKVILETHIYLAGVSVSGTN